MTKELWVPPLRPARDDAPTGFILSANNRRNRELFMRYWLVQRDAAQSFFSNRPTLDEAPQSVRQTNATHIPPIRPFEAVSDIAEYRIVVGIGQARWRVRSSASASVAHLSLLV